MYIYGKRATETPTDMVEKITRRGRGKGANSTTTQEHTHLSSFRTQLIHRAGQMRMLVADACPNKRMKPDEGEI